MRSSTSFQVQIARFRFSPNSGHIAASHRSATKSADARRGVADDGELRQAAGAVASVATDKRGVTRLQPQTLQCTICREGQKPKFIRGFALAPPASRSGFFLSFKCRTRATRGAWPCFLAQSMASCLVLKVARMPPPTRTASA